VSVINEEDAMKSDRQANEANGTESPYVDDPFTVRTQLNSTQQ